MNTQATQPGSTNIPIIVETPSTTPSMPNAISTPSAFSSPNATTSPSPTPSPSSIPVNPVPSARVSVELPSNSTFNPFDPTWIKLWEDVGPIAHLVMLCLLVWLMTRFVEAVKGK